jgi:hypothetical protein
MGFGNRRTDMPSGCELARGIRKHHSTLQGLAVKYHCTVGQLRSRLNDSGFNTAGEPNTIEPVTHRTTDLKLSAGGSAMYVGGGDWDRGLPTTPVVHRSSRKVPTGLDWEALRPADEPLTAGPAEVLTSPSGHTFQPDETWVQDKEGLRVATRHQHEAGSTAGCPVRDCMQNGPKARRTHSGGKLTDQQRHEICVRYLQGESATSLADEYDVTGGAVTYTLRGAGVKMRTKSEAMRLLPQQGRGRWSA